MSIRPWAFRVVATRRCTSDSTVTSATTTRSAPSAAKRRQSAAPMPPAPPVTTTTRPRGSTLAQHADAPVDKYQDGVRSLFVARIGSLAAAVQHQVVTEDRRVLVGGQGQVPAIVAGVGAVHLADVIGRDMR